MDRDVTIAEEINGVYVVAEWITEFSCWSLSVEITGDALGPAARTALETANFIECTLPDYPYHRYIMYFSRPGDYNVINGEVGLRMPPEEGSDMTTEWNPRTIFEYAHNFITMDMPTTV